MFIIYENVNINSLYNLVLILKLGFVIGIIHCVYGLGGFVLNFIFIYNVNPENK